ncbi:thiol reductant ABC exporter subunit CydC [Phycicoccus duodecadis]|uniref:ATP-binding cassette subfamily C protein CydC/ATP-binding cassette subfamily C protein CydCD n=1 Tax=Phycicoccus duodecadis TaxID=173053 RepID=A0A2N3YJS7_9MICO|nr:thiol reductant ABC exporter subunit CydC [Phycicoccus duodecadis]PKW27048.1 ATP-binding cassette subfamily C protein CydC/ATP-binding cassette subfamily C protein CydCD [Phycicoccus duodecadis]
MSTLAPAPHPATVVRPTRATVLGGLLGGAATTSGIALTATSGWLVVRASERPVILTLLAAIVAVRAFGMARPYFRYLERLISHDAALAELADRRVAVFAALVPLTPARLGRRSRSAVLNGVVDDLTDVVEAQVRVTVPLVSGALAGLAAAALTAWFAPAVGMVVAALLVVVALGCAVAWRAESGSRDELLAARAEVARVGDLVARQAGELRAIGAERDALRSLDAAHATWRAAVARQSRGRALVAALLPLGTAAATVAAAQLVDPAAVGAPVAALLVLVPVAVGEALAPLVDTMRALARAQGSSARLTALLDQQPAVRDPATPATTSARRPEHLDGCAEPRAAGRVPVVRLEAATASWTRERPALSPTDLELRPGRHVAVVGPNGSGKSTLLAVLARSLDVTAGRHTRDGVDVRGLPLASVRADVAVVDDEPHVFAGSLAANLRLARPDADDGALRHALALAGLAPWLTELPDGLDTRLGTGGRGVSGGERTRLGIARAVLAERAVVLLDEPTAHLDDATATAVLDDVLDATRDRAVVLVSHRPEALGRFDHVLDLGSHPSSRPDQE